MANIYGIVYALIAFGILAAAGKYMALLFVDGTDPELMNRIQQMLLISQPEAKYVPDSGQQCPLPDSGNRLQHAGNFLRRE